MKSNEKSNRWWMQHKWGLSIWVIALSIHAGSIFAQSIEDANKSFDIKSIDVACLWTATDFLSYFEGSVYPVKRDEPLGYIGKDFQRFYIHFLSAEKDANNPLSYRITGKTMVKDNICSFNGSLNITKTVILPELYNDGISDLFQQGYLEGSYEFKENENESGSGILKGTFRTNFYIDNEGKVLYDGLRQTVSDPFNNNQFAGTWTSYKTGAVKKCNWGDYRIPDAKGLNSGAAEFRPLNATEANGWKSYEDSFSYNDLKRETAQEEENRKWWE